MSREVHFRLISPVRLGLPGSLEAILNKTSLLGYQIGDIRVGAHVTELFALWNTLDDLVFLELNVAYEKGELTFHAFDEEFFASFWIRLRWVPTASINKSRQMQTDLYSGSISREWIEPAREPKHIIVTGYSDAKVFTRMEYGAERNSQLALELVRELYFVVSPAFGWIEICGASGYTKQEDVEDLRIPHILGELLWTSV